jgi:ribosomal-protein-alanine N-acetyltransferase
MEGNDLEIGEYEEGDLREMLAIEQASFPNPWTENLFRGELTCPMSRILVGRFRGGQRRGVAAYLVYWLVLDEAHLHSIAVRPGLRRIGIATRMLAEAVRRSRREGALRMTLEVRRSNRPAQNMYDKLGFTVQGVRPGYYADTGEDALILWAELDRMSGVEEGMKTGAGEGKDV